MSLLIKNSIHAIDRQIRRAFSDSAMQYDQLTGLHKEIGRDLIKKMRTIESIEKILEVGIGTGWLTGKICFYFPESKVIGLDFADGMIEAAKKQDERFQIVQADCVALPFKENTFDCIVSNLAYQWIDDLKHAFALAHRTLKPSGAVCFTLFGYQTLEELFVCLDQSLDGKPFAIRRLPKMEEVREALELAGFQDLHLDYERIKIRFPDMLSLIKWTKEIGANRLQKDFFVGKDRLAKASGIYDEKFRDRFGIFATFEVLWVMAKKN